MYSNKIRMVTSTGSIITTFAGTGTEGSNGDGGAATASQLYGPMGVSVDKWGNVYIADNFNHKIRMVSSAGIITTFAGTGISGYDGDGGAATSARLSGPTGVAADISGNVYFTDPSNHKIRMVNSAGIIKTFAGGGSGGDGVSATSAQLYYPYGVAVDISGKVYIADYVANRIRMVNSAGIITTVAGTGEWGYNGDDGAATSAQLYFPFGVTADSSGNVFIADHFNHKIRMVSSTGIITTFAGTGTYGNSGDDGAATSARLYRPTGVAADSNGQQRVYIADSFNNKIRVVTRGPSVPIPSNQPAQVSFALTSPYLSLIWRWFYCGFFTLFNLSSFCIHPDISTPFRLLFLPASFHSLQ